MDSIYIYYTHTYIYIYIIAAACNFCIVHNSKKSSASEKPLHRLRCVADNVRWERCSIARTWNTIENSSTERKGNYCEQTIWYLHRPARSGKNGPVDQWLTTGHRHIVTHPKQKQKDIPKQKVIARTKCAGTARSEQITQSNPFLCSPLCSWIPVSSKPKGHVSLAHLIFIAYCMQYAVTLFWQATVLVHYYCYYSHSSIQQHKKVSLACQ